MQGEVLQTVQKEHVLGVVIKAGLQGTVHQPHQEPCQPPTPGGIAMVRQLTQSTNIENHKVET